MQVKIEKLHENAKIPFQKHEGEDACYDFNFLKFTDV